MSRSRFPGLAALYVALALTLSLTGCGVFQRRPRPTEIPPPTQPALVRVDVGVVIGRIAVVNPQYRFIVVDFVGHRVPPLGSTLQIRREGQVVGTVRLTAPSQGSLVSADVLTGEPRVGDEIR